jgi:hypothetical protein
MNKMNPHRRECALRNIQSALATASQLNELLSKISDVRSPAAYEADTWPNDLHRAKEYLDKALAHVTRHAVL